MLLEGAAQALDLLAFRQVIFHKPLPPDGTRSGPAILPTVNRPVHRPSVVEQLREARCQTLERTLFLTAIPAQRLDLGDPPGHLVLAEHKRHPGA